MRKVPPWRARSSDGLSKTCGMKEGISIIRSFRGERIGFVICDGGRPGCCSRWRRFWSQQTKRGRFETAHSNVRCNNMMTADQIEKGRSSARVQQYVLITPARNEAAFIELTLKSVIDQTVKPLRWVIVSDGSTDGTDELVKRYAVEHPWIELVRMPERRERHFAGKVRAFDAGRERVKHLDYEIIGNLDGDISFEPDFFSFLLSKFAENPRLGVGGTAFREGSQQYNYRF